MTSSCPNHLPKAPLQIPAHCGWWLQPANLERTPFSPQHLGLRCLGDLWHVVLRLGTGLLTPVGHAVMGPRLEARSSVILSEPLRVRCWTVTKESLQQLSKGCPMRVPWSLRAAAGRLTGRRRWLSSHGASCISGSPVSFKAKSSDFSASFCSTCPQLPAVLPHPPSP